MGDFNEDVRGHNLTNYFQRWGMHEAILHRHGHDAPNTFRDGRVPIDGIFCSTDMHPFRCGYAELDWGLKSDHRMIWIDFDGTDIFGSTYPPLWCPKARRLKLMDPRVVAKFVKERTIHSVKYQLQDRVQRLHEAISMEGMTSQNMALLEELDKIRVEGINKATGIY